MPHPKADSVRTHAAKDFPPLQHHLTARQQREVARYAANFAVDPAAVIRQLQARVTPAVETEIGALASRSDSYESAKAETERALRAQILGDQTTAAGAAAPTRVLSPASSSQPDADHPEAMTYARTGT